MSRFTTLAESIHRCHRVAKSTTCLVFVDVSLYLRAGLIYSIYHPLSSWHFEQAWTASMGPTDRNISAVHSYNQNLLPICKKHSLKETPHAFCVHKDIKSAVVQAVLQEVQSCCLHSKHTELATRVCNTVLEVDDGSISRCYQKDTQHAAVTGDSDSP